MRWTIRTMYTNNELPRTTGASKGLETHQKEIWKTNFEPSSIKLLQKTHGFPFICAEFWQVIYLMLYNKEH